MASGSVFGLFVLIIIIGLGVYGYQSQERDKLSSKENLANEQIMQSSQGATPNPQIQYNQRPAPKYCSNCGSGVLQDSEFCTECGTKVN